MSQSKSGGDQRIWGLLEKVVVMGVGMAQMRDFDFIFTSMEKLYSGQRES